MELDILRGIMGALSLAKNCVNAGAGEWANIMDKMPAEAKNELVKNGIPIHDHEAVRKYLLKETIEMAGSQLSHILQMAEMMQQAFMAGRASAGAQDGEEKPSEEPAKRFGFGALAGKKGEA